MKSEKREELSPEILEQIAGGAKQKKKKTNKQDNSDNSGNQQNNQNGDNNNEIIQQTTVKNNTGTVKVGSPVVVKGDGNTINIG